MLIVEKFFARKKLIMYNLKLNNYYSNPKNSTIYTPKEVSEFIFNLLKDKVKRGIILDPCCGQGSLLQPWKEAEYRTWGIDIDPNSSADVKMDFFTCEPYESEWVDENSLVICNPPFNGAYPKLAPELWLDKIIELFGKDIPLVLFVPAGFRLNLTLASKRHAKFEQGQYPPISSIITLPKNIFAGIIFHSEILIFNIPNLQPHYFYSNNHE